jgi:hypothetical protein
MTAPSKVAAPFDDVLSELRFYVRKKNPRTALLKKELHEIGHALRTSSQGREWARMLNEAAAKGSDGLARFIISLGDQTLIEHALKNPNLSADWVVYKFHAMKKAEHLGAHFENLPIMRAFTKSELFPLALFDDVISASGFLAEQVGIWREAIFGLAQNSQLTEQHIDKMLAIVNDDSSIACQPTIKSSLLGLIIENPVTPERYVLDFLSQPSSGVDFNSVMASVASGRPLTPKLLDAILAVNHGIACVSVAMNQTVQPKFVDPILAAAAQNKYFDETVAGLINRLSENLCSTHIPQVMQQILTYSQPFLPKAYLDEQGVSRRLCQILVRSEYLPFPALMALLPYAYLTTVEGKTALDNCWSKIHDEVLAGRFDLAAPDRDGVSFIDAFRQAPEVYEKLLSLKLEVKTQGLLIAQEQQASIPQRSRKL